MGCGHLPALRLSGHGGPEEMGPSAGVRKPQFRISGGNALAALFLVRNLGMAVGIFWPLRVWYQGLREGLGCV